VDDASNEGTHDLIIAASAVGLRSRS
jgi:hypothetical protein